MSLQIPEHQHQFFLLLSRLPEKTFEELRTALSELRPSMSPRVLAEQIATRVNLPSTEIEGIVKLLISLYATRERYGQSKDELINDVINTLQAKQLDGPDKESQEWGQLRTYLNELTTDGGCLEVTAKAASVAFEQNLVYGSSRILTDIRPVFQSGETAEPLAALIIHTLKLTTHAPDQHETYFFSLDSEDIRDLRKQLDRAIAKENTLKKMIEQSGVPYLELQVE